MDMKESIELFQTSWRLKESSLANIFPQQTLLNKQIIRTLPHISYYVQIACHVLYNVTMTKLQKCIITCKVLGDILWLEVIYNVSYALLPAWNFERKTLFLLQLIYFHKSYSLNVHWKWTSQMHKIEPMNINFEHDCIGHCRTSSNKSIFAKGIVYHHLKFSQDQHTVKKVWVSDKNQPTCLC